MLLGDTACARIYLALLLSALCMPTTGAEELAWDDLPSLDLPTVLTPTRLRQGLADVPNSVTVISAAMLQQFGIYSLPEALRLVPGMALSQVSGHDYRINYHGGNVLVPRRMNVLIDGVSLYRPALARIDWDSLPVTLDDIERIEVTRGPSAASYGEQAMLAIVNIITKHPQDTLGSSARLSAGSQGAQEGMLRYGGQIGATTYRLSVSEQRNGGFDDATRQASYTRADHDSSQMQRLNFRSHTALNAQQSLELQAALVQGVQQIGFVDQYQRSFPDQHSQDYYLNALWRNAWSAEHESQVQAYTVQYQNQQSWQTCPPAALLLPQLFTLWQSNPAYAYALLAGRTPSGGTAQDALLAASARAALQGLGAQARQPVCVQTNQNYRESRSDVELQDTLVLASWFRMVNGVGLRRDSGNSQTYLGGRVNNDSYRLFSNLELKPWDSLTVNAGGFWEKDQLTGQAFAPRLGLNWHVHPQHTLRFLVAQGKRMPDILEQRANWRYQATDGTPAAPLWGYFFQSAQARTRLGSEQITSRELGYLGNFPRYGMILDLRLFDDQLSHLISEKLQVANFAPTNDNSVRQRGLEGQIDYTPSPRWLGHLAYAYLRSSAATNLFEQSQYASHSGSVSLSYLLDSGWRIALAVYGNSANAPGQSFYGRQDVTLGKTFTPAARTRVYAALTIRHLDNLQAEYVQDVGQSFNNTYRSPWQYLCTVQLSY